MQDFLQAFPGEKHPNLQIALSTHGQEYFLLLSQTSACLMPGLGGRRVFRGLRTGCTAAKCDKIESASRAGCPSSHASFALLDDTISLIVENMVVCRLSGAGEGFSACKDRTLIA
jgi:hypothetical protein